MNYFKVNKIPPSIFKIALLNLIKKTISAVIKYSREYVLRFEGIASNQATNRLSFWRVTCHGCGVPPCKDRPDCAE